MHPNKNNCFEAKCGETKLWGEKLVFEKILSMEFILSQFFTSVEFSCVNFTNQIFILGLFQASKGENGPHLETIQAWHSLGRLTSCLFSVFRNN